MSAVITVMHVIVCIFLIAVILLQRGKGADIGAAFGGGGGATVFGSRGAGNFLTKLTTISAVVFMATSLALSYLYTQSAEERLFTDGIEDSMEEPAASPFEELGTVPADPAPGSAEPAPES
ncbi:preprotein translocase subunit SecG [Myxococcota bacterium]|nr:preprotein translocase subunit SecG [Myxococcota bacterium]